MTRFARTITATAEHIDELGHVNNAVWVQWIQDVAVTHWMAVASAEHHARYVWVIVRHEIDYRGNIGAGDSVTAETWVDEPPRGARFTRLMRFTGTDGKIKVESKTDWAMLDRATGRLTRVPSEVAAPFLT